MKIDIHTHTRKVKAGDAATRNIEAAQFSEVLRPTNVRILAITNHNYFDSKQYIELREAVKEYCFVWPGIELDVFENGIRSHLLVIVNPRNFEQFDIKAQELLAGVSPDAFNVTLKGIVEAFDDLDCLYVAHYRGKKPDLGDEEIDALAGMVKHPKRILKEAANSISAGIYISHGHNSIYGSDVQDWKDYEQIAEKLPDLRLPVESFEQFCLLLEKDETMIDSLLNSKVRETIELTPFGIADQIKVDVYNDINILFGSKGTGKTEILIALRNYFNERGHKTSVYISNDKHLNETFDISGNGFNKNASDFEIDECVDEIKLIKNATEEDITSIGKYVQHFAVQETNKIVQKLQIHRFSEVDEQGARRQLSDVKAVLDMFKSFEEYIVENEVLQANVEAKTLAELGNILERLIIQLAASTESKFFDAKSISFLNHIVTTFGREIAKKTNQPQRPTKTGFAKYATNRIRIECAAQKILANIQKQIQPLNEHAGSLGEKGDIYCRTNVVVQTGTFSDGRYNPVKKGVRKNPPKEFVRNITSISKHIYSNDLFEKIAELNRGDGIDTIDTISELLLFYRHFVLNDQPYQPSNGESSMILLYKELMEDKEIYLIDEPEKSLGNDYISEVIVPLLKEKAMLGKKIIIATHDANIAVRTLPYSSIYRLHDKGLYFTLTGNPFRNTLKCTKNAWPDQDWKEISMKTLEGGKEAFGERGKIYGN